MATYYVDPSAGSDGAAGTSFGAAWATLQHAFDTAVAGDTVLCCATATHAPSAIIDVDTNSGNSSNGRIRFIAAAASGDPVYDGSTKFHVSDANLPGSSAALFNATVTLIELLGFDIECSSGQAFVGVRADIAGGLGGWYFQNCRVHGADTAGIQHRAGTTQPLVLVGCEIDHNGIGIDGDGAGGAGAVRALVCSIHDNTSHGITSFTSNIVVAACLFYDNGGDDITGNGGVDTSTFFANSHRNSAGSGLAFTSTSPQNNIVVACSFNGLDYAIDPYLTQHFIKANNAYVGWNHYRSMVTGNIKNSSGGINDGELGFNNIDGDPLFVSTTDGSEDFHLQDGSPLLDAGPLGDFIGALPIDPAEIGGGGGGLGVSQGLHGIEGGIVA